MLKAIIFLTLGYPLLSNAGYLGGLHSVAPVATYAASAPVVHYSSAPAVSSSYIHQSHSPAIAALHAAPAVATVHAAPAVAAVHAAPAITAIHAGPAVAAVHAAPAITYSAPLAIHSPSIGTSHQSVLRGFGGSQAISHYSKAVDSPFSSVRKYDTRITNDALAVAPIASYAHAAPLTTYTAHATPVATYTHAAPVTTYSSPIVTKTAALSYSPAAVVSHAAFSGLGAHYAW